MIFTHSFQTTTYNEFNPPGFQGQKFEKKFFL
jgi:hypothetical protein